MSEDVYKMKTNGLCLLNPEVKYIEKYVEAHEVEWKFADDLIYAGCIEAANKIELRKIKEKDVKGPIRTFLLNWGMMGRVLGRIENKGWESKLKDEISKNADKFKTFRVSNIENFYREDLQQFESEIKECYSALEKIIKPTSTAKVLHLLCPDFFPLWDTAIRDGVSKECKNLHGKSKSGINNTSQEYYNFMVEIKEFLKKKEYNDTLSELREKCDTKEYGKKPKLRIIDEFMFSLAHDKWCLFSWDEGREKVVDCEKHLNPLKDILDISWVKNAVIPKSDDKTICIVKNRNSAKIKIIVEKKVVTRGKSKSSKKEATLTINDNRKHTLKVEEENGKLNIFCTYGTFYAIGHTGH